MHAPGRLGVLPFALARADPIWLQTGEKRTPPAQDESRQLLALICPLARIGSGRDYPGMLGCKICPSAMRGLPGAEPLLAMAIYHGQFTKRDAEETLLATGGCEPHSRNYGGSVLFTSNRGKLQFNRYFEGTITDNCVPLARTDGRTILVCERQEGHQSVVTRLLYTIDLLRSNDHIETPVLVLTDTMQSCGLNYASNDDHTIYPLQKAAFRKIGIDPDSGDVVTEVEFGSRPITEAQKQKCLEFGSH